MKNRMAETRGETKAAQRSMEVLATFGEARLIREGDKIGLWGGSMADRLEALEWVSLMMPDAVVSIGS
jgi:hypothetical protein